MVAIQSIIVYKLQMAMGLMALDVMFLIRCVLLPKFPHLEIADVFLGIVILDITSIIIRHWIAMRLELFAIKW